jgi:hypothetical protein
MLWGLTAGQIFLSHVSGFDEVAYKLKNLQKNL